MNFLVLFSLISIVFCQNGWEKILKKVQDKSSISIREAQQFIIDAKSIQFDTKYIGLPLSVLEQFPVDFYTQENHLIISNLLNLAFIISTIGHAFQTGSREIHPKVHNVLISLVNEKFNLKEKIQQIALSFYDKTADSSKVRCLQIIEGDDELASLEFEIIERSRLFTGIDSISFENFTVRSQDIDKAKQVLYYAFKVAAPSNGLIKNFICHSQNSSVILNEFQKISNGSLFENYSIHSIVSLVNGLFGFAPQKTTKEIFGTIFDSISFEKMASENSYNELLGLYLLNWDLLLRDKKFLTSEINSTLNCTKCCSLLNQIADRYTDIQSKNDFFHDKCSQYDRIKQTFLESKKMNSFIKQFGLFLDNVIQILTLEYKSNAEKKELICAFMAESNKNILYFRNKVENSILSVDGIFSQFLLLPFFRNKISKVELFDLEDIMYVDRIESLPCEINHNNLKTFLNSRKSKNTNVVTSQSSSQNSISKHLSFVNKLWMDIDNEFVRQFSFKIFAQFCIPSLTKNVEKDILIFSFYLSIQQNLNFKIFHEKILNDSDYLTYLCEVFIKVSISTRKILSEYNQNNGLCSRELLHFQENESNLKFVFISIITHLTDYFKETGSYSKSNNNSPLSKEQFLEVAGYLRKKTAFKLKDATGKS